MSYKPFPSIAFSLSDEKGAALYFDYFVSPLLIQRLVDNDEYLSESSSLGMDIDKFVEIGQQRLKQFSPPSFDQKAFQECLKDISDKRIESILSSNTKSPLSKLTMEDIQYETLIRLKCGVTSIYGSNSLEFLSKKIMTLTLSLL